MEITPEIQAIIDEKIDSAVDGLKAKNKELLGTIKKLQRGPEIDPAEVERLESQIDKLQSELSKAQKANNEYEKNIKAMQEQLQVETGFTQKLLVDNGLTDALVKNGVAPQYLKAAKALFAGQAQIVADGDKRLAKIGDKELSDAIKEWASTEEGKYFVAAPANSGGGATGSRGNISNNPDLQKLSPVDRINAAREAAAGSN